MSSELVPLSTRQLDLLARGRALIAEARTIEEVKDLRDKALAMAHYLRQRGDGEQAALDAAELRLRAERRLGELLTDARSGHPFNGDSLSPLRLPSDVARHQSSRWQKMLLLPEVAFEEHLAAARESGELTTAGVLRAATAYRNNGRPADRSAEAPVAMSGGHWHVEQADCLAFLAAQPPDSIDLVFGSPPYELARLYLENGHDPGAARSTEDWVAWMVQVFKVALRCCRGLVAFVVEGQTSGYRWSAGPALLMADLHRAGVHLRKPPVYRRVGIPGSGGPDWLRNDFEFIVCAAGGGRLPWSDNTAMGAPPKFAPGGDPSHRRQDGRRVNRVYVATDATQEERANVGPHRARRKARREAGKGYTPPERSNPGNVIDCGAVGGGNMGSKLCHDNEAPFPESLAEFFVRTFCPPGGLVCDPFAGSGTTLAVALGCGRRATGCDLRASQVRLTERRLKSVTLPMFT